MDDACESRICAIRIDMKVEIEKTEWYPVYVISTNRKINSHEIPDALYKSYISALKRFDKIQDELENIYNGAN